LLGSLQKNDPDYANVEKALTKIKEVTEMLNESKRKAEKLAKMQEIQDKLIDVPKGFILMGLKECLYDGVLVEERLFGSRHVYMFLFPDVLMCTYPRKKSLKIEHIISLKLLQIMQLPVDKETGQTYLLLRWREKDHEKEMNLCLSKFEAKEWLERIQSAQQNVVRFATPFQSRHSTRAS